MQASFLEWTFLQRVAVRLAHAYVGVRDAPLADRHTKEVDTSERSMPKSKVDRSNITATRYQKVLMKRAPAMARQRKDPLADTTGAATNVCLLVLFALRSNAQALPYIRCCLIRRDLEP